MQALICKALLKIYHMCWSDLARPTAPSLHNIIRSPHSLANHRHIRNYSQSLRAILFASWADTAARLLFRGASFSETAIFGRISFHSTLFRALKTEHCH